MHRIPHSPLSGIDDVEVSAFFEADCGVEIAVDFLAHGDSKVLVVPLETLVDQIIDENNVIGDYREIYCYAHEFRRLGEKLTEKAQRMEDSNNAIAPLFGFDADDLDDI